MGAAPISFLLTTQLGEVRCARILRADVPHHIHHVRTRVRAALRERLHSAPVILREALRRTYVRRRTPYVLHRPRRSPPSMAHRGPKARHAHRSGEAFVPDRTRGLPWSHHRRLVPWPRRVVDRRQLRPTRVPRSPRRLHAPSRALLRRWRVGTSVCQRRTRLSRALPLLAAGHAKSCLNGCCPSLWACGHVPLKARL